MLAAAVGSVNAATIAVANAGFETQALTDGTNNSASTDTSDGSATSAAGDGTITSWTIDNAADHLAYVINPNDVGGFTQPTEGSNAAFLQNNEIFQGLSGFDIKTGDTITVTFDAWSANAGTGPTLEVNFAGIGLKTASGITTGGAAVSQSLDFIATSDITTGDLWFHSTEGGNRYRIDNVAVSFEPVIIPEPSSTALLGLGGLALILRRRK